MVKSCLYCWRGFRLPQRSHLLTLNNFVSEKSGKHWIKLGNREILRRFIFFLYPRLLISNLTNFSKYYKLNKLKNDNTTYKIFSFHQIVRYWEFVVKIKAY